MRETQALSVTLARSLLTTFARFDLTPDDRATLELIRADIDTLVRLTPLDVPEADITMAATLRDLVAETQVIARKYA
jgi:hypothetical protein